MPFPTDKYQFLVNDNETGSINLSRSTTVFTNITNVSTRVDVADLDFNESKNTARVDILILVPPDEPVGARTSNLTFTVQ